MILRQNLRIFLPLGCYFLLHLLLKVLLSDGVELDEAEQFLWGQDLHLGYGAELPLYTWLQWGLFAVFGTSVFAVALLKNLLLFATCVFTWLAAREAGGDDRCASVSMFTLFLIPQIVFESQRVLTHMVLATALAAAALYLFLRIVNSGRLRDYLLFGFTAGLGMMAKYNFVIFLLALLLAAFPIRAFRPSLANGKMVAASLVLLTVVAAPFGWLVFHPDLALAKSYKLHAGGGGGALAGYVDGVKNLVTSTVSFASLPLVFYALIFSRARPVISEDPRSAQSGRLLGRMLLIALTICLLLIFCFRVTQFRVRWMQPLLLPLPILLSLLVRTRLDDRLFGRIRLVAMSSAIAVLVLLNGRILFATHFKPTSLNEPYSELAGQIARKGFSDGVIVAGDRYLGGNLRPHFLSARVVTPDTPLVEPLLATGGPVLVVWSGSEGRGMPGELLQFLRQHLAPVAILPGASHAEAAYHFASGHRMRLDYIILHP